MVSTRGLRYKFSEGERVLCYEPDPTKAKVLYDSKVLEVIESKDKRGRRTIEYLIHFQGWNSSWDRCVSEDFVLKDTEENRQLQRDLAEKSQLQLGAYLYRRERKKGNSTNSGSGPAKRPRHGFSDDGSSSSTQPDEGEMGDTDSSSGSGSSSQPHSPPNPHAGRANITLPSALRDRLTFDYHLVVKRGRLARLPATPCAAQILESFVRWFARAGAWRPLQTRSKQDPPQRPDMRDVARRLNLLREVADGLRVYFDFIFRDHLLYKQELNQYYEMCGQYIDDPDSKSEDDDDDEPTSQDETVASIEDITSPKIPEYSHLPPDPVDNESTQDKLMIKKIKCEPNNQTIKSEPASEVPEATSHEPGSPSKRPSSPKQEPGSSKREPDSPKREQASPKAELNSPKPNPESPELEPDSPKREPDSPKREPDSPKREPDSPKREPDSPKQEPDSPKQEPDSPKREPDSPKREPDSPLREPVSPKRELDDSHRLKPSIPKREADSPKREPDESVLEPDTNSNNQESDTFIQERKCSLQESSCSNQQPSCSKQQPSCSKQQPSCSSREPRCSSQEPSCSSQEPSCSGQEPSTSSQNHNGSKAGDGRSEAMSRSLARRLRSHKSAVSQSENEEPMPSTSAGEQRTFETLSSSVGSSGSSLSEGWSRPPPAAAPVPAPTAPARTPLSQLLDKVTKWKIIPREDTEHYPCRMYGAIHLARLFVKLPDFLNATQMPDLKLKLILKHIDMFVQYLDEHGEWFGEKYYITDGASRSH